MASEKRARKNVGDGKNGGVFKVVSLAVLFHYVNYEKIDIRRHSFHETCWARLNCRAFVRVGGTGVTVVRT